MILLPFDVVVGYGIMIVIGWVVAQWLWRSARQRAWVPPFERSWMWQCAVCTYLFVDSRAGQVARCPRCQSWTERGTVSREGGGTR